jgi:SAM-dependent methyltransferase
MELNMEKITDWALLWRQLVEVKDSIPSGEHTGGSVKEERWQRKAAEYDGATRKYRPQDPGPISDLLASRVAANSTVLDIGAGAGRWTMFFAPRANRVTALDSSPSMLGLLRHNVAAENLHNVTIVQGSWPEAVVEPHDVSLCAHAMYWSRDLMAFVERLIEVTRRSCYLLLRTPRLDGVMAGAARRVLGQPHDSPNLVIAYNVLVQMGLCPNVLVDPAPWKQWSNASLEEALSETKRRLRLGDLASEHDEYIMNLLKQRLTYRDGRWVWPADTYEAVLYWDV